MKGKTVRGKKEYAEGFCSGCCRGFVWHKKLDSCIPKECPFCGRKIQGDSNRTTSYWWYLAHYSGRLRVIRINGNPSNTQEVECVPDNGKREGVQLDFALAEKLRKIFSLFR